MKLSELYQKRATLVGEARAIIDVSEKESRALTSEEVEKYDGVTAELDTLEATIERSKDSQKRQRELAAAEDDKPEVRTENASYDKAFGSYLRHGFENMDNAEKAILKSGREQRNDAPLSVGTPSAGGYSVPTGFYNQLVNKLEQASAVRAAGATIIDTAGGNPIQVPLVTTHADASWGTEGTKVDAVADTFDQVEMGAFIARKNVLVSIELIQDNAVNLESYLANELGRAIGRLAGDGYAVGGGTTEPSGVVPGANVGVTTASSTVIAADELIDLIYTVTPPYRAGACWLLNDTTEAVFRKLKFSISGDPVSYIWQPSFQAGEPDRLLGYSIFDEPSMDGPSAGVFSASDLPVAFGDFSRYFVRIAGGFNMVRLNERYMDTGQIGFMGWLRTDGVLTDLNAVKTLRMKP